MIYTYDTFYDDNYLLGVLVDTDQDGFNVPLNLTTLQTKSDCLDWRLLRSSTSPSVGHQAYAVVTPFYQCSLLTVAETS